MILFLAGLLEGGRFWAGGREKVTRNNWQWSNEQPFAYRDWAPEDPDNEEEVGSNCLQIREENWKDKACSELHYSICEKSVP